MSDLFKNFDKKDEWERLNLPPLDDVKKLVDSGELVDEADLETALFNCRLDIYKYLCKAINKTTPNDKIEAEIYRLNVLAWECDTQAQTDWLEKAIKWNDSWNPWTEEIASWQNEIKNLTKLFSETDIKAIVKKANSSEKQDDKEYLYRLAALHGNAEALYHYSKTRTLEKFSHYLLLESAKKGYAPAQVDIGFDCSLPGTEDWEARKWFEKAAEQNHPDAFRWLANMSKYGRGGLDPAQTDWFKLKAIENGSKDSDLLRWMAYAYRYGNKALNIEPSPEKSMDFLMLLDDDYSRIEIAQAFLTGDGIEKSKAKGLLELKKVLLTTENTDILYKLMDIYKSLNLKSAYIHAAKKLLEMLLQKKERASQDCFSVDLLLDLMDHGDDYDKMQNDIDKEIKKLKKLLKPKKWYSKYNR